MKEGPILMFAPMIRAILGGRKRHTRRIIKPQPQAYEIAGQLSLLEFLSKCPYGVPGDRLWVKETFVKTPHMNEKVIYRANSLDALSGWRWTPSIFMPRQASRITLEITNFRVERVRDMTIGDAGSEGYPQNTNDPPMVWYEKLWNEINTKPRTRWNDNPWVWVIEFKRIES